MVVSLNIDSANVRGSIELLAKRSGTTVDFVAKDTMRLWINDIMRLAGPKTLKAGRATVEQDLQRLFEPIDDKAAINAWKKRAAEGDGDVFVRTKSGRMRISAEKLKASTQSRMRSIHKANRRKSDGRVFLRQRRRDEAWGGEFLVPRSEYRKYLRDTQKRVGFLKSRFGKAALYYAAQTRGRTPAYKEYIRRQIPGGSYAGRMNGGWGFIRATNDATYASNKMVSSRWWSATRHRRERDLVVGTRKRMADITKRFNQVWSF